MRKIDIDHLLENAVAKALGVKLPHANHKVARPSKKVANSQRHIRHAA